MAEIQRFHLANSEYIDSLINANENKNTKDSTRNRLEQFEKWAVERKKELEKYAAEELNSTLCEFFAELRKTNGDDYEPDSLCVIFSAIDRHLKSKSYPQSIREDNVFSLATKFWKERQESYVLKVKAEYHTVLKVFTLRKKKFYGNVDSLGLRHQNP